MTVSGGQYETTIRTIFWQPYRTSSLAGSVISQYLRHENEPSSFEYSLLLSRDHSCPKSPKFKATSPYFFSLLRFWFLSSFTSSQQQQHRFLNSSSFGRNHTRLSAPATHLFNPITIVKMQFNAFLIAAICATAMAQDNSLASEL